MRDGGPVFINVQQASFFLLLEYWGSCGLLLAEAPAGLRKTPQAVFPFKCRPERFEDIRTGSRQLGNRGLRHDGVPVHSEFSVRFCFADVLLLHFPQYHVVATDGIIWRFYWRQRTHPTINQNESKTLRKNNGQAVHWSKCAWVYKGEYGVCVCVYTCE